MRASAVARSLGESSSALIVNTSDQSLGAHSQPPGTSRGVIVKPIATTDTRDEVQDLAGELTADIALYLASVSWIETGVGYTLSQTLRARGERLRLEVRLFLTLYFVL